MTTSSIVDPFERRNTSGIVDPLEGQTRSSIVDPYQGQSPEIPTTEKPPTKSYDVVESAKNLGKATVLGGLGGALAPELLSGAGMGMMAIPGLQPFAPTVIGAGRAMRGARLASSASGAVGGAVGETAGQAVEAGGGGATAAEVARLAGGMFSPEALRLATKPFTAAGGYGLSVLANRVLPGSRAGTALRTVGQILEGQQKGAPIDLTEPQKRFFEEQLTKIRGGAETFQPYSEIMQMLRSSTQAKISEADAIATQLERNANALIESATQAGGRITGAAEQRIGRLNSQFNAAIERIENNAKQQSELITSRAQTLADTIRRRAEQEAVPEAIAKAQRESQDILNKAQADSQRIRMDASAKRERISRLQERVAQSSETMRSRAGEQIVSIGKRQTLSDLGSAMRDGFVKQLDRLKAIRENNVKRLKGETFQEALTKELAGARYQDTKEFKEVAAAIGSMIKTPETGLLRAAPEQKTQLTRIRDLLIRGEGRQDPDTGEMVYTKLGFEGLESLRRMLRDRASGLPAEGYDAINQQQAGELARQVEKTMVAFSPKLRTYLDQYKKDSEPINQFRSKLGKVMTGVENFDDSMFKTDPILLGSAAFRSATTVNQLVDILGKDAAEGFARAFIADKVRGGTARDVSKALDDSRDWIGLFPNLVAQLNQVAGRVGLLERVGDQRVTGALPKLLKTSFEKVRFPAVARDIEKLTTEAQGAAAKAQETGVKTAADILSAAEREAQTVLGKAATEAQDVRKGVESTRIPSAAKVEKRAETMRGEAAQQAVELSKTEAQRAAGLTKEALAVRTQAQEEAKRILGSKAPEVEIPRLIQGADVERLKAVAPILLADPRGKEVFAQAMGQRVARMMQTMSPSKVTNDVKDFTGELVRLGLVSQRQVDDLLTKVNDVYVMPLDNATRATMGQRFIRNFFTGYAAPGVGRGGSAILDLIQGDQNATEAGLQSQGGR